MTDLRPLPSLRSSATSGKPDTAGSAFSGSTGDACATPTQVTFTQRDERELSRAVFLLERTSLAERISAMLGGPVHHLICCLPLSLQNGLSAAVRKSLGQALNITLMTLGRPCRKSTNWFHKTLVTCSGAAGGAFGGAALLLELPMATCLMLRSIAEIAREQGEDLNQVEARIACFEVFALGGPDGEDDRTGLGYFTVRRALTFEASRATRLLVAGLSDDAAPALARLVETVAVRYGIVAQEKMAAQLVPVIGALGGATLNYLFMTHFQAMATGHFIIRRLERTYGKYPVLMHYHQTLAMLEGRQGCVRG